MLEQVTKIVLDRYLSCKLALDLAFDRTVQQHHDINAQID